MRNKKPKKRIIRDSDADGLTDNEEILLGTNPDKADSDHDGVNDYQELNVYGTDPLNSDTDGDGVRDGDEIKSGRNPRGAGLLKDFFIPHEGNNFEPKALNPYRLFFYALSSILFKVILVGAIILLPIEAWLTPDILLEQSRKIMDLTNAIRKNLNIGLLIESQRLNQAAYGKAEDMLLNQYFSHTGRDNKTLSGWLKEFDYNYSIAGENLAMGFASPEEVVNGWTRSRTHYQNMIDPDFKEIGVGMVSGLYANIDTTLVAQYFGAQKDEITYSIEKPVFPAEVKTITPVGNQLLGEKLNDPAQAEAAPKTTAKQTEQVAAGNISLENTEVSMNSAPDPAAPMASDSEPPVMDQSKSSLYVDQPIGQTSKIVRAEVYLSADTATAQVNFGNYLIELKPETDKPSRDKTVKWIGQTIIFRQDQEQIFNPVVLATVWAEDQAGNKSAMDLNWDNIRPANTTALEQYLFVRQNQSAGVKTLFDVTSALYKIILFAALIALALNIFIQIRKQRPHIIVSSLSLILLLIILIMV